LVSELPARSCAPAETVAGRMATLWAPGTVRLGFLSPDRRGASTAVAVERGLLGLSLLGWEDGMGREGREGPVGRAALLATRRGAML